MTYRFEKYYGDEWIRLPAEVLRQLDRAGEKEIKILLALAGRLSLGPAGEEEIDALLAASYSQKEIGAALAFWRGAGILSASEGEAPALPVPQAPQSAEKRRIDVEEPPLYSPDDLARAAEDPSFKNLVKVAQDKLGKMLNNSEIARLYSFVDYLKLPAEVVMLSIQDCCSRGKNGLRYVSKQLQDFADNGIDTYEKADAELARRRRFDSYSSFVRNLFGFGERSFTAKERDAVNAWQNWGYGEDVLTLAYERTVSSAKKPSIAYMHKILDGWYRNGWLTPEDVQKGRAETEHPAKTYDLDDFFEAAVERTRREAEQLMNEKDD